MHACTTLDKGYNVAGTYEPAYVYSYSWLMQCLEKIDFRECAHAVFMQKNQL